MRPPYCPTCGVGHYLRFDVRDVNVPLPDGSLARLSGIAVESCDDCGYFRRLTPTERQPVPVLPMLVGVCQETGCGIEFSYQQKRTAKKAPDYCPSCRKGRYRRGRPRGTRLPFGAMRRSA